ncbi:MAG: ABC transporter ATP-binding protein [Clostridia bacterium]|nr:ABC transporter ATP-binding protein [Clostridia bacterium]MBP3495707.1 ABC transporter ATP-binding protein [Clostridia bacterium]MBQ7789365.1 ABC transporter ATP-binding protein [Clostridia bacterium]
MAKKEREKDKGRKAPFKVVIKDTLLALKISFKHAPLACIIMLFSYLMDSVMYFITGTYALKYIIDSYEKGVSFEVIAKTVLLLVVIPAVVQIVIDFIVELTWSWGSNKISTSIHKSIFEKNTEVELSCFENVEFYDKYVKASCETSNNIFGMTFTVFFFFYTILNTCLYGTLLFRMDPVFIIFAIIPLLGSFFKKKSNILWHKHTTEDRVAYRRCQYAQRVFYSNEYAKEMRLTNSKSFMLNRYEEASNDRKEIVKKYGKKEMLLDILGNKISSILANPLAIAYAVFRTLISKTLGLGDCAVVINSVSELSQSFIQVTNQYYRLHERSLFVEDYKEFMQYEPKMRDNENSKDVQSGTIKLENVSFKYFGSDDYVLKNISIELGKNEKIALVGHNGAGKSTLIKLLLRLYDPTEGKISLNGEDIRNLKMKQYRDMFSVVFQDFKMIALPVIDNVLMRPKRDGDEEKVIDALKLSGAYERIMKLPNGINTLLTKEFSEDGAVLSVGEGQKIAIAHAFIKDSPYIILDEPTSALDPVAESEMYSNMMKIGKDKGMVFISHRLSSAVSADRIYMLENGEIIESGTHSELMRLNGKYADMFKKQAQNYIDLESEVAV